MFSSIKSICKSVIKKGYRASSSLKTFQWSFKGECSSAVRDGINQPNLVDINEDHSIIKSFYLPAGPSWPTSIRPHLSTKLEGGSQTSMDSMAVGTRSWFEGMRLLKGRSSRSAQLQKSCNMIIHFFHKSACTVLVGLSETFFRVSSIQRGGNWKSCGAKYSNNL